MRLVIAEKHSVAQAIGQALGDSESHDGYITAGGVLISWAQGHLVCVQLIVAGLVTMIFRV